jgi:hypothetical protein
MIDRMQRQRFEYKYIITEHVALGIRDFAAAYLDLDSYGAKMPGYSYPVHSLYLDSPNLTLYQNTINGDKNRYKLRIRFYENAPAKPLYLEIKKRVNSAILKKRATVVREGADLVLARHAADPAFLVDATPEQIAALEDFTCRVNHLGAVPQTHVAYEREAWIADGANSIRLTLDRNVRTERRRYLCLEPSMSNAIRVFGRRVILELKFTDRFPVWFNDLVRLFGLRPESAAKYVEGVVQLGDHRLLAAYQ